MAGARSRPCAASGLHRAPRAGRMLQAPQLRAECTNGRAPSKDEEVIVSHSQSRIEKRRRTVRRLHPDTGPACIRGPGPDQCVWRAFRSGRHSGLARPFGSTERQTFHAALQLHRQTDRQHTSRVVCEPLFCLQLHALSPSWPFSAVKAPFTRGWSPSSPLPVLAYAPCEALPPPSRSNIYPRRYRYTHGPTLWVCLLAYLAAEITCVYLERDWTIRTPHEEPLDAITCNPPGSQDFLR